MRLTKEGVGKYSHIVNKLPWGMQDILKKQPYVRWWLGGGALRALFAGERVKDYDLFCVSSSDAKALVHLLKEEEGFDEVFTTDAAISLKKDGVLVQVVRKVTGQPEHVLPFFDFSVAMVTYDGNYFYFHPRFFEHLAARKLVTHTQLDYPLASMWRLIKYMKRGYHAPAETIMALLLQVAALGPELKDPKVLKEQLEGIDVLRFKEIVEAVAKDLDIEPEEITAEDLLSELDDPDL